MLPFDRLIRSMDAWAQAHTDQPVLAQIGAGHYEPMHMRWTRRLSPVEFRETMRDASIMVAHAGMGSFFVAMEMERPIVMLPRHAAKGEHTTDHQLHTVRWLCEKPGVYVATSEKELDAVISQALGDENGPLNEFPRFAAEPLLTKIRQFLVPKA
jgi:UDP-N-acetylglucosamine transferase subunit ALG13